jgi:hypothetical protein
VLALGAGLGFMLIQSKGGATKRNNANSDAAIEILPLEPATFKEGDSKFVLVTIRRQKFQGPVLVRFEGLPSGIRAGEQTLTESQDSTQVRLTVSFGAGAGVHTLRLVASADNLRATAALPLTVAGQPTLPKRERGFDDDHDR